MQKKSLRGLQRTAICLTMILAMSVPLSVTSAVYAQSSKGTDSSIAGVVSDDPGISGASASDADTSDAGTPDAGTLSASVTFKVTETKALVTA